MLVDSAKRFEMQEIHRFANPIISDAGYLRWDFPYLMDQVFRGLAKASALDKDIVSLGIDTWGVDYGIISGDGKLFANPISYRDARTIQSSKQTLSKIGFSRLYAATGIQFLDFNTVFQLYDDVYNRRIDFFDKKILMMPDLIAYYLTGKFTNELTNISTTGMYDANSASIDKQILEKISLPESVFSPIVMPGTVIGKLKEEVARKHGLNNLKVISVCTHDTASAITAIQMRPGTVYLSSGTWSLLGVETDKPIIDSTTEMLNFTNEIGYGRSNQLLRNIMGMFIIEEVKKDLAKSGKDYTYDEVQSLVGHYTDNDTYIDPDDRLFAAPGNMIDRIYGYLQSTNQPRPRNDGMLLRVIYESLALKYRHVYEALKEVTHRDYDELVIVGGGNKAKIMDQLTANSLKIRVVLGSSEATVLGNALTQFVALKEFPDLAAARDHLDERDRHETYQPQNMDLWEKKYQRFVKITGLK